MKKLRITIEGKAYEVLVEALDAQPARAVAPVATLPVSAPIVAPPPAPKPVVASGPGMVTSPLAGKVVAVDVKVGDTVAAEQNLMTIEAMKMNTYIPAPKAGTITEVLVKAGDAVDEGAVLIRLG
jgi:biotin carboxyl carrier protein